MKKYNWGIIGAGWIAGKAVLCEKPFTMNKRQLEQLVETARNKQVFLMEAIRTRFLPSTRKVLEIAGRKELGNLSKDGIDLSCNMMFEQEDRGASSLNCTLMADSPSEANLLFEKGWIRMESVWITPGPITIHRIGEDPERIEFPEPGNCYQYEAAEVMRCLDEGLIESPALPLDFSLDLIGILDRVREICGIRYRQDEA